MHFPGANTLRVGDSFSITTLSTITNPLRGITHDGTRYVAVGNGGLVMTSVDGVAWTQVTTNISSVNLLSVAFGGGVYVATSLSPADVYSSTDLATWTLRQAASGTTRVVFGNGVFVAHGPNIYSSTNGTSWTLRTSPGSTYELGFWANNYFVLCQQSFSQNIPLAISSDGTTWTSNTLFGSVGVTSSAAGIGYWGDRFVVTVNRFSGSAPRRIYVCASSNPSTSGFFFTSESFTQQLGAPVGLPDRLVIMQSLGSFSTLINADPNVTSTWGLSAFDTIPSGGNVPAVYANDIIVGVGGSTNPTIVRSSRY